MNSKKKALFPLGIIGIPVILLSVLLWALPALATHNPPEGNKGTLLVAPTAVSPDDINVGTADRTIIVTLTDPNINTPIFVGTGPTGQIADPLLSGKGVVSGDLTSITTGGERVPVGTDLLSTFTVALTANPISDGFTPLADRDDNGDIDINDIEIVLVDGGGLVAADIAVSGIFNAARGQVTFTVFKTGLAAAGAFFDVRFASAGVDLSRGTANRTTKRTVPPTDLIVGESFTWSLGSGDATIAIQDTGDGTIEKEEVTVIMGGATLVSTKVTDTTGVDSVELTALANMFIDTRFSLRYIANESGLVPTGDVVTGDTFDVTLNNTIRDTNGDNAITVADVTVVAVDRGVPGDLTVVQSIAGDGKTGSRPVKWCKSASSC